MQGCKTETDRGENQNIDRQTDRHTEGEKIQKKK